MIVKTAISIILFIMTIMSFYLGLECLFSYNEYTLAGMMHGLSVIIGFTLYKFVKYG